MKKDSPMGGEKSCVKSRIFCFFQGIEAIFVNKYIEKALCKDLLQTKEQVSDTNSSEITIIPA